jgi:hypothetical protein
LPTDIVGTYSLPAGYLAVAGTTILTTQHNPIFQDVAQGLTDRIMANGAKAMTAELTLSGNPVTLLGAAPKQYVDAQALAAVAALDIKPSVVAATTANITLSAPQTIDGVSVVAADRVLVKNQTAPAENGIYIVGAAGWSRATDMAAWTNVPGAIVAIEGGTQWRDTLWLCTADAGGTLGTTAMTWRRFDTNVTRNAQTGTSYTITTDDHNRHLTMSNASAVAVTLPQATTNFGFGFNFLIENLGAGAVTITPTTSTINGGATLILRTGDVYRVTSDGTNYRALPHGVTYAQIDGLTEDTAPAAASDFLVTADASATLLKKVKPQNLISPVSTSRTASYTVVDADRSNFIRFSGLSADVTLTLPAASGRSGFIVYIRNDDPVWGVVVDPNGAELIDGVSTRRTNGPNTITIMCDGTGWRTIAGAYLFRSAGQTVSAGGLNTVAHGLGLQPRRVWYYYTCVTASAGFTPGEEVFLIDSDAAGGAGPVYGYSFYSDATNVNARAGTGATVFVVINKGTGAATSISGGALANWNLVICADAP